VTILATVHVDGRVVVNDDTIEFTLGEGDVCAGMYLLVCVCVCLCLCLCLCVCVCVCVSLSLCLSLSLSLSLLHIYIYTHTDTYIRTNSHIHRHSPYLSDNRSGNATMKQRIQDGQTACEELGLLQSLIRLWVSHIHTHHQHTNDVKNTNDNDTKKEIRIVRTRRRRGKHIQTHIHTHRSTDTYICWLWNNSGGSTSYNLLDSHLGDSKRFNQLHFRKPQDLLCVCMCVCDVEIETQDTCIYLKTSKACKFDTTTLKPNRDRTTQFFTSHMDQPCTC
jgi:hypothetical protein